MKVLHTADWHSGISIDNYVSKDGKNTRIEEQRRVLDDMYQYVLQYNLATNIKIGLFCIDGDVFHSSRPMPIHIAMVINFLTKLSRIVRVVILKGNHDDNQSSVSALEPLKEAFAGNDRVIIIDHEGRRMDNMQFIPHGAEFPKFSGGCDYLIGHFHMAGAVYGSEQNIMVGTNHTVNDIPVGYKRVIAGHIHMPQEIMAGNIPVDYTGSIVRINFGEREDTKSFLIHDTISNTIVRVPINCIQYAQYEMDEDSLLDSPLKDIDAKGKIVKLIVNNYTGKVSVEEIQTMLEIAGVLLIKAIILNKREIKKVRDANMIGLSPQAAMEQYFKDNSRSVELIRSGKEILSEVGIDG